MHIFVQLFPHVQVSACSQTKCQASYLHHACSTGIGPLYKSRRSMQCCCGMKRCHSASACRVWPSEPILSCLHQLLSHRPLSLSRGSTRLCEDDLHLDSCAFAGHCRWSLAFHCHPTPVRPGLSHRTLNPVNESRPLFQAFFIPIPATSPRWNATRMPATGYLALESLCVEIGEAKGERGSRERKDNRQSALQGAWPAS